MLRLVLTFILIFSTLGNCQQYTKQQCQGNRQVIVHLFEWYWTDIANECEQYLGPKGFCAVQVSPPMEHIQGDQWWTRYQPVSYLLESRSGTRDQFVDMVKRCHAVGVNIYVDAVINHMTGMDRKGVGTGGSNFDGETQSYPDFSADNFHQPYCPIQSYTDPNQVRNCWLVGLTDLDGSQAHVQDVQAAYMNDLIDIGVTGFRVDAAKHMWPADIEALQAKLKDVNDGGRPYFFMEVIDLAQSGEISVNEYYGVGQTTEFRYVIKVAEGAKNFGGLQAVYDPGWGMSDPEHAFVFVDNHDNQRGHGGGGQVVTHKEPRLYRFAQAFTLANDYGTKRVMSSYFFDNTDQGPPDSSPGCGDKWVCEHRWKSIGQMAEFTNTVFGEPVEFKVAEGSTLAMSRGSKGFFAMGDLSREFDTGLPDGEYCDIISECKQKVQVSGGKAFIEVFDTNEPVVALCQGCTGNAGDHTTSKPPTTDTTAPITTPSPTGPTTEPTPEKCCEKIILASTGGVQEHFHEALGTYILDSIDANGKPIYQHHTELLDLFLHFIVDPGYWTGWQFTRKETDTFGFLSNEADENDLCPSGTKSSPWRYYLDEKWHTDETVTINCDDGGSSTTPNPESTTHPNPGGLKRTIIFVEKETFPGSDVFIVGGQADGKTPIDITINPMPEQWESYNSWMEGDEHLDWDGPEPGQGTFNGYDAMGTAGAWTTDDDTEEFYYELNGQLGLGPHFWIIDMEMDCSQTKDGWFEFNTIFSIGGEDGEPAVEQGACTGEIGGTSAITGSTNHMALCGKMSIFSYGKDSCRIDNIPAK